LKKLIAFLGLLGVIYALALQHGVFDRAAAHTLADAPPVDPSPVAEKTTSAPRRPANTKPAVKCGSGIRAGNASNTAGTRSKCN